MSVPIVLTSDGCEFTNYFSDNVKVVEDAEIALTKASVSIPVVAQQLVRIPFVSGVGGGGARNEIAFRVMLDGLERGITWRQFYNAWNDLNIDLGGGVAGLFTLTEDQFYGGNYNMAMNNNLVLEKITGGTYALPTIGGTLARALTQNYDFFDAREAPPIKFSKINTLNGVVAFNGENYNVNMANCKNDLGIQIEYIPSSAKYDTSNVFSTQIVNLANTTIAGTPASITINSAAGAFPVMSSAASFFDTANGDSRVDCNGGYFQFKLDTMSGGTMAIGFANAGGAGFVARAANFDCSSMPFGALFEYIDGSNDNVYTIDGGQLDPAVGTTQANTLPVRDFTGSAPLVGTSGTGANHYFLRIVRGEDFYPNGGNFKFELHTNATIGDFNNADTHKIYESPSVSLNPQNLAVVVAGNGVGNKISECKYIGMLADSLEQINAPSPSALGEIPAIPSGLNCVSIRPGQPRTVALAGTPFYNATLIDFYNGIGYEMVDKLNTRDFGVVNWVRGINDFSYEWKIERDINQAAVKYFIGTTDLNDILEQKTVGGAVILGYKTDALTEIPRILDVKINDLTINSMSGSYARGGANYQTSSITKDVGTIQVDKEYFEREDNFNLDLQYEPFNLIYRRLNNVGEIPVNQLQVELSFKDFTTNKINKIKNINGTLKVEVHMKKHNCGH